MKKPSFGVADVVEKGAGCSAPASWLASLQRPLSLLRAHALLYWIYAVLYSHDHPEQLVYLCLPLCHHLSLTEGQAQPEYVVSKPKVEVARFVVE